MRFIFLFILVLKGVLGISQTATFITISSGNRLDKVTIGASGCTSTTLNLCSNVGTVRSIALDGNILYIVNTQGYLYKNTLLGTGTTANCSFVGQFSQNSNAYYGMTVGPGGIVYAAINGDIETYNPTTNSFKVLGTLPNGWIIGGDLLFYQGNLYEAVNNGANNSLVQVDTNNIAASILYMNFNAGTNVFGFASVTVPCANNQAYAISNNGTSTDIYAVDMQNKTQATIAKCTLPFRVNDAASIAETQSTNSTTTVPLHFSSCSSVTYMGNAYTTDTTLKDTVKSSLGCDSVYHNVTITINKATNSTTTINTTSSYTWNGTTYTTSGIYTKTGFINSAGCDSTATLVLTITTANPCWKMISAGGLYTAAIKNDGTLWAWGADGRSDMGNGSSVHPITPIQIGTSNDWAVISVGEVATLALKNNGTLWGWGLNVTGSVGNGNFGSQNLPIQIGTSTNWAKIYAGRYHSLAIMNDGTLWAWGNNNAGQLGDGLTSNRNTPYKIGTDNDWMMASPGSKFSVALKTNGTLWGWGNNGSGALGDGTNINKNIPTKIGTDNDWISISAGETHTLAIKKDSSLWVWGDNIKGQLGDGTNTNKNIPTKIGNSKNWKKVQANYLFSVAIKYDATIWAWGYNFYGQLGNGTNINSNTPVLINSSGNYVDISSQGSGSHVVALKDDGSILTWGWNYWGQIGDGTKVDRNQPILVINGCNPCSASIKDTLPNVLNNCKQVVFKGITYTSSAVVVNDTLKSYQGCDSVYRYQKIVINPITPTTNTTNYSNCKSIIYKGNTYTTSTIVKDTVKSYQGCDSIYNTATITITPISTTTHTSNFKHCSHIVYNGITYTSTTFLKDTIKNASGCDSIYNNVNITILPITPVVIGSYYSSCDSVLFNSVIYYNSTIITDTIKSIGGCDSIYKQATISIFEKPTVNFNNTTVYALANTPIVLKPITTNGSTFNWTPAIYLNNASDEFPVCTPGKDTTYKLIVYSDSGCRDSSYIKVLVSKPIKIPTAFSPNGDGINDRWEIDFLNTYPQNTVQIFDRAGQLLYSSFAGSYKPWNGKHNGKDVPVGVYYFIIKLSAQLESISGYVTILR